MTLPSFFTYSDADHGGDVDNGKSTGGYLVTVAGGAVSWASKLQSVVALSSTEAEYIAAVDSGKEVMWMRNILSEFGHAQSSPSTLFLDNQAALNISRNPEHHGRMKHLDLRTFWLRNAVEEGHIITFHLPTDEMPADLLTKPLSRDKLVKFRILMGLSISDAHSHGGVLKMVSVVIHLDSELELVVVYLHLIMYISNWKLKLNSSSFSHLPGAHSLYFE